MRELQRMTMTTIDKPTDRVEWLVARHPYFNASDAGCLYGVHPHRALGDVVLDKLSDKPANEEPTEAMERGNRLEPMLLEWFGDRHGCAVSTPDVLYVNDRLMATLDGTIAGADGEWIEAKTTRDRWDEVPEHVYWQVVAQAAASGRTRCHVVWIDADMAYKDAVVNPAPEHVADVLERAEAFMSFIDLGMTPEGVEMSAEHLAKLYPSPVEGKYVDLTTEQLEAVQDWETVRQQRVADEKAEKIAKDRVARLFEDAEGLRYEGRLIATWKSADRSSFDSKRFKDEHPDMADEYQRTVPVRTMRATKAVFG